MNKNNDNKLVPKLRFPEFKDVWFEDLLGNITKDITTGKLDANAMTENGQYRFYTCAKNYYKIDKYAFDKEALLIAGNGAYLGYIHYYKGKFNAYQRTYVLSDITQNVIYLKYYLEQFLPKRINQEKKDGNTPYIVLSTLTEMTIFVPKSPAEQQKIAACLSSLDEVITAESQKLELLKEHKKGLLQNLFPQEGERVPKLRFKEFEDCGEWEEKTLGEVYEFKTTNSFSRDFLNYQKGTVKNIHYGDIHTKFNTLFDITKENVPFINSDVPIEKIKEDCYCQEGDMIFADASEDLNDIGKSIEVVNLNDEKLVSGLHTILARQKVRLLQIGFGGYLFKSGWIRKQIQKESQGAKVFGISASRISGIKIKFPSDLTEQQKIAACLSSLDDLINAQNQKIETLKLHKKGLLQGLFPDINEQNG